MPGRSEKDQRKPQAVLGRVMSRQMCCVMHCPAVQLLMCVMKPHRHRFLHVWQVGNVEMTEQEIEEFREVFDLVDKDKGGAIEADEIMELMDMLGIQTDRDQVENMINEIDEDGNGEIDFDEFLLVSSIHAERGRSQQRMGLHRHRCMRAESNCCGR